MNLTLHLTNRCNLKCTYCFVPHGFETMTREVAFAAAKFAIENTPKTGEIQPPSGLLFYGGEPLLERTLIHDVVAHTQEIKERTGHPFIYKITTNGTLLDEEFLKFCETVNLMVGLSYDGIAQDDCRKFHNGKGSAEVMRDKIPLLLKYQPYAIGLTVLDASTAHRAYDIVKWMYEHGFRYITVGMNYDRNAPWTPKHLDVLASEYRKMGRLYAEWMKNEEKVYLSSFDMKILSHLKGEKYNSDRRVTAQNQLSVAPNGKLYAASGHVGDVEMSIGDVFTGIDTEKHQYLMQKGSELLDVCKQCAIRMRCNYAYDSIRRVDGEVVMDIAPLQCAHEQLITPIADKVAEKLYEKRNALFLHKHYNELYPVMSLVEDGGYIT